MDLSLTIPDILLFIALILLLITTMLLVKKISRKNYMLVSTLAIYFCLISITMALILFTRYNIKLLNSSTVLVLMSIVYTLYNVFHYFSLYRLIHKKNRFRLEQLFHLISVLIIAFLIYYFFEPIYYIKGKGYNFIYETQKLTLAQTNNFILPITRIIHPILYFLLGGYLLFSFYKSPKYLSFDKKTRHFILFLYVQKILLFLWVTIGFIGFNIDNNLFSTISITGFSITAVITSCYILLNPDLILQITKLQIKSKKTTKDDYQLTDLSIQLYKMLEQYKFYLNANYSLTNLSSDTDISVNIIREIISNSSFKNFSSFINSFRIAHAELLISNGYLNTYSIESLCKDSGFQSEVTFYRVFKKIHNCTPKEFSYNLNGTGKKN